MAEPDVTLLPVRLVYAVAERLPSARYHVLGEVELVLDSDETAWLIPSPHLLLTERILDKVAALLRPLGIRWMRGWGNGGRQGRILTANGPVTVLPNGPEVWIDEGD